MFLPPNVTALVQPMDQNGIRITKLHYKSNLLSLVIANKNEDIISALKNFNLRQAITLMSKSWDQVTSQILEKCWNPIFNDVDNSFFNDEDDVPLSTLRERWRENLIADGEEAPLIHLLEQIDNNQHYTEEEVNEWLRDEDVPDGVEDEDIDSENESDPGDVIMVQNIVTDTEAIESIDKVIDWASQNNRTSSEFTVLQNLRESTLKNVLQKTKQCKITNFFPKLV
ncbi:tigger transposable element-derived protein 2-like [Episyrphus balteatus]|uniref:tigger transposable element-derived protein 2-like n=1 Tax=Episyrphus balteatus TaxID=286459 RepID=UPI0024855B56|nr:tigger transposable element-derived protein 2-like [Episyrphus balteatus]